MSIVLPDFPPVNLEVGGAAIWRVGMDLVQIGRIEKSVQQFGDKFINRLFTASEAAYASEAPDLQYERLAARFAAKEACIKALNLSDVGVNWRDMEVLKQADGHCTMGLYGLARKIAEENHVSQISLSLTHDGGYAAAIVVMVQQR